MTDPTTLPQPAFRVLAATAARLPDAAREATIDAIANVYARQTRMIELYEQMEGRDELVKLATRHQTAQEAIGYAIGLDPRYTPGLRWQDITTSVERMFTALATPDRAAFAEAAFATLVDSIDDEMRQAAVWLQNTLGYVLLQELTDRD